MQCFAATDDFLIGGEPYPGLPLLVADNGEVVLVVLLFLIRVLVKDGRAQDPKTWSTMGAHMYDFWGYLEKRGKRWDHLPSDLGGDVPPIAHYRNWCVELDNEPSYINQKLGTINRFYKWARDQGLIDDVPSSETRVVTRHLAYRVLGHLSDTTNTTGVSASKLKVIHSAPKVLSVFQVQKLLNDVVNPTHKLAIRLGVSTGLRPEEIVTFPKSYIIDTDKSRARPFYKVHLDPQNMQIKYDKPRTIEISRSLMDALWQYKESTRNLLLHGQRDSHNNLLLNQYGAPFVDDGLVKPCADISARLGFHINPHMLRHTFATHTLYALEKAKSEGKFNGSPLLKLRSLLGHKHISATQVYFHLLDEINNPYPSQYMDEIDDICTQVIYGR
jgi:site-specific recombinase XerD